jgi:hypothetical protein
MQQDGSRHIPAEMEIVFDGCRDSPIVEDQTLFIFCSGLESETKPSVSLRKISTPIGRKGLAAAGLSGCESDAHWEEDNASNECEHHSTTPSVPFCFFNRYNMVDQQLRLAYTQNETSFMERARRM